MIDGFIPGSRGSLSLDTIVVLMIFILAAQCWSLLAVRKGSYAVHQRMQLLLAALLVVVLGAFEIDMRLHGWSARAKPSPYYTSWVYPALYIHLAFAMAALLLWAHVIRQALRHFPRPIRAHPFASTHRRWARWAVFALSGTALSGWVFYWLAFIA